MLSHAKPLFASPASKRVLVACAAKHENLHAIWQLACRSTQSSAGKTLGDVHPLFQSSQFKYSSDSYLQRDFKDDNLYEKYSQMIPRNITKDAASMSLQEDQVAYDEDYDKYYSHMPPSSMKNQDIEQIDGLEMVQHDDVESSESLRINYENGSGFEKETARDGPLPYVRGELFQADDDYVELEEDWEIMHQTVEGKSGCYEVYDNIDDVNDIVQ